MNPIKLTQLLREEEITDKDFEEFADTRGSGAKKIADNAQEKGGLALLTYDHFIVKMPYYEKANQGKFDAEKGLQEYIKLVTELYEAAETVDHEMSYFQKLVGKIEVLGELIIRSKES
jgi:hypothetical protein